EIELSIATRMSAPKPPDHALVPPQLLRTARQSRQQALAAGCLRGHLGGFLSEVQRDDKPRIGGAALIDQQRLPALQAAVLAPAQRGFGPAQPQKRAG